MPVIRSLVLTVLLLVVSGVATAPTGTAENAVSSLFVTTAALAQGPACNKCMSCGDDLRYISDDLGASNYWVESEATSDCKPHCEDFGGRCQPQTALAPLADALLKGEIPSVVHFVETQAEQMRYVQGRDMVVFLSECDGRVALAFPVREDEREILRDRLRLHLTPVA